MSRVMHVTIAAIPLTVEYVAKSGSHAEIERVWTEGGLDSIRPLLSRDVINSILVACIKHERNELAFLRRVEEQERTEA